MLLYFDQTFLNDVPYVLAYILIQIVIMLICWSVVLSNDQHLGPVKTLLFFLFCFCYQTMVQLLICPIVHTEPFLFLQ